MPRTRVVHCRRERYDVYVGRPSIWGNAFVIGRDGDRAEVIRKYEAWLQEQPHLLARLPELRGKVLGCWCAPEGGVTANDTVICHGQILARLADEGSGEEVR